MFWSKQIHKNVKTFAEPLLLYTRFGNWYRNRAKIGCQIHKHYLQAERWFQAKCFRRDSYFS